MSFLLYGPQTIVCTVRPTNSRVRVVTCTIQARVRNSASVFIPENVISCEDAWWRCRIRRYKPEPQLRLHSQAKLHQQSLEAHWEARAPQKKDWVL